MPPLRQVLRRHGGLWWKVAPLVPQLTAAAHSSHSNSPIVDFSKLQSDVHMAVSSMFTARRSSDLENTMCHPRLWGIIAPEGGEKQLPPMRRPRLPIRGGTWEPKSSVPRPWWGPNTNTIWLFKRPGQRGALSSKNQKLLILKLSAKMQPAQSLQCTTLCREYTEHMWELEECALRVDNKSHQDFLMVHQAVLQQALQSLKEDLHSSYSLLLGPSSSSRQSLHARLNTRGGRTATFQYFSQNRTWMVSSPKEETFLLWMCREICQWMKISPWPCRRNCLTLKKGKQLTGSPPWSPSVQTQSGFRFYERGKSPLLHNSLLGLGP